MVWLIIGIILLGVAAIILVNVTSGGCTTADGGSCSLGQTLGPLYFVLPVPIGFLIAAWASYRATTTLTDDGIKVRAFFENRTYPWSEIRRVINIEERRYLNGIRSGTERKVVVELVNGKRRDLPAPLAGLFVGKQRYQASVRLIGQAWNAQIRR
jgi:Bacterial PH domain